VGILVGLIDEIMLANIDESSETARLLASKEGVLVGISAGAAVRASLTIASRPENAGQNGVY
jgi:cysteine synthase A